MSQILSLTVNLKLESPLKMDFCEFILWRDDKCVRILAMTNIINKVLDIFKSWLMDSELDSWF